MRTFKVRDCFIALTLPVTALEGFISVEVETKDFLWCCFMFKYFIPGVTVGIVTIERESILLVSC